MITASLTMTIGYEHKKNKTLVSFFLSLMALGGVLTIDNRLYAVGQLSPTNANIDPYTDTDRLLLKAQSLKQQKKPLSAQVRIGVKIKTFQKSDQRPKKLSAKDASKPYYLHDKKEQCSLGASVDRTGDFYCGKWHIVTQPQTWNRATGFYSTKVTVYRALGNANQAVLMEEAIDSFNLQGTLVGEKDVYVLVGSVAKRVRSKDGTPIADLAFGFSGTAAQVKKLGLAVIPDASAR